MCAAFVCPSLGHDVLRKYLAVLQDAGLFQPSVAEVASHAFLVGKRIEAHFGLGQYEVYGVAFLVGQSCFLFVVQYGARLVRHDDAQGLYAFVGAYVSFIGPCVERQAYGGCSLRAVFFLHDGIVIVACRQDEADAEYGGKPAYDGIR